MNTYTARLLDGKLGIFYNIIMQKEGENKINVPAGDTYSGVGGFIWEVIKVFFWAFIVIMPIRIFLFQPFFVQGASMEPNFQGGNYLIINELGYKNTSFGIDNKDIFSVPTFRELNRGDVVVFRYPKDPTQFFIKRVIGLPGEKVIIVDGKVRIVSKQNPEGFILDEYQYLPKNFITNNPQNPQSNAPIIQELSQDEYFVMGDNRAQSHDSRAWGPLDKKYVIGKALLRAWPLSEISVY